MFSSATIPAPKPIPIRWRTYEVIGGTILFGLTILDIFMQADRLSAGEMLMRYVGPYYDAGLRFHYGRNMLMPQLSITTMFYISYLFINFSIVGSRPPALHTKAGIIKMVIALVKLLVLAYLLALAVNLATKFAHPHLFNYRDFQLFALFGYNEHPLSNLFFGFGRAIAFTGVYTLYAWLRQRLIVYLQRPGNRAEYPLLVARQVTSLLLLCLAAFGVLGMYPWMGDVKFTGYISLVLPVLLVNVVNIFWLFPKAENILSLFRPRMLFLLLASTFICALPFLWYPSAARQPLIFIPFWLVLVLVLTPLSWLWYQQRKEKIMELRGLQKALSRSKADLGFLRGQINPHFLFNTLNTLYGTALQEGSERTAAGIQKLGDMMRFMLHDNHQDFIPMHREIEYLQHYIDLQRLRIQSSPNISIESNIMATNCHHLIAPMLLVPMVENAFKHGISLVEPSWIQIKLDCDSKSIRFEVRNSMHLKQTPDTEKERSGVGIHNVIERLKLIYAGRHQVVFSDDGRTYRAFLAIQF